MQTLSLYDTPRTLSSATTVCRFVGRGNLGDWRSSHRSSGSGGLGGWRPNCGRVAGMGWGDVEGVGISWKSIYIDRS